ncbi:hypothetical protein AKK22_12850 [Escherichia coli]|nr:hypothetical protein AKK22_12850 [Escherichia coli]
MIWQPEFTDKTLSRKPGAVQPHIYQNWCTSNTGGCRAGSQMCASYCGCNGNLLSCCCSYGSPF